MSEILVISYSNTGPSRLLAEMLCKQQGWPMAEISEVQPRCGLSGQLSCLLDSWLRRQPSICYTGPHPNEYDAVVLIAPIWSWRLAGPVRSFLKLMSAQLPDIAMISVTHSFEIVDALAEISSLTGCFPVLSTIFNPDEINNENCLAKLQIFSKETENAEHSQIFTQKPIFPANQSINSSIFQLAIPLNSINSIGFINNFITNQIGK